ncbi:glycosyltransferase family 2 protein [Amorphus orientalis]|uniref:Glycosyltransferase involved in cell wall biosynthesis n=1 Tax=Amorphus orientalis TaxID=649198 RepID=A0AAE3VS12_9HYPH|nr:glycosyltransferase family A protein [Amorphus orientalis]MDQ0316596.1 glycosyltransferase involved in cell wall biosynthesis [Amorphus orientalis]
MARTVSVIVPTLRRPDGLARAVASLAAQTGLAGDVLEIVVVDNAPEGGAEAVCAQIPCPDGVRLCTVHEPRMGVATARNAGIEAASGEIVGFLDDDCTAPPDWLATRLACLDNGEADAVFGPRHAVLEGNPPADAAWFASAFTQDLREESWTPVSDRCDYLPLTGALMNRSCFAAGLRFDPRLDRIGGEDILLFKTLRESGARMVWCAGPAVVEHVPASRLDHAYIWRRRYVSGRIRCLVPSMLRPPARREIAVQMAKGAAQVALAGPLALIGRLAGHWPPQLTSVALSGLGKLSWWRGASPRFYGEDHVG